MRNQLYAAAMAVIALGLAGCQSTAQKNARVELKALDRYVTPATAPQAAAAGSGESPAFKRLDRRWLAHEATTGAALPPQADLPAVFDQAFAFSSSVPMPLAEVARRIATDSGIPVRIMPDVTEGATPGAPSGAGAFGRTDTSNIILWEQGSLRRILDGLASQTGLEWFYTAGEIQFSRLATATFRLDFALRPVATNANLGGSGGGGPAGGAQSSGVSGSLTSTLDTSLRIDPSAALLERLRTVLTPSGRVSISNATNTVTIRDVRAAVEAAGKIIAQENAMLSRSIEVEIEFVSVSSRDISEYGLDWTAVYSAIQNNATRWGLSLAGPGSLVSSSAGALQFTIPTNSGRPGAGTKVVAQALSEIGQTSTVFRRAVTTGHNQPAPINVVQSQGYLARLTPAPTGGSGLGAGTPGAEQATITTGFQLTVTPTMLTGNRVQVSLALSLSSLDRLDDVQLGGGARIQTPTTSALQFLQAPIMQSGEVYAVQVYERTRNDGSTRGLDRYGLLGTQTGRTNREVVVMIVRPVLLSSTPAAI